MRDGRQSVEENRDPSLDVACLPVTVSVDWLARDVLENEVGLAAGRHARVEELRDVGMRELREQVALAHEAARVPKADERGIEELERDVALESPVGPPCQPDAAHAAVADRLDQRVRAE